MNPIPGVYYFVMKKSCHFMLFFGRDIFLYILKAPIFFHHFIIEFGDRHNIIAITWLQAFAKYKYAYICIGLKKIVEHFMVWFWVWKK